jgi:serine/threonine protein kinase
MSQFRSNFLGHLYWSFQDERFVYLVMHFLPGGDLRYYLSKDNLLCPLFDGVSSRVVVIVGNREI